MAINIETLIHAMGVELGSLKHAAETEVCSSIRAECRDEVKGFEKALAMVMEYQKLDNQLNTITDHHPIYANVNRHSKYYGGQRAREPFEVKLIPRPDGYIFHGQMNEYRPCDLDFYVKINNEYHAMPDHNWAALVRAARQQLEWLDETGTDGDATLSARRALLKDLVGHDGN